MKLFIGVSHQRSCRGVGGGEGLLILHQIIREKTKNNCRMRGRLQASHRQKEKFRSRFRDGRWDSGRSLLLYLENLVWCFCASSQQQTDTQKTAEDRQPVLATSEGEV